MFSIFLHYWSIEPAILVTSLLRGYSTSASHDVVFLLRRIDLLEACFHYFSARPTYGWSCDLPKGGRSSFVLPDPGQVGGSLRLTSRLDFDLLDQHSRSSMFDFVRALEGFFFFGSPCTLHDFSGTMPSLRFNKTSLRPLRLHVDRGLRTWVPMGPHRPGSQRSLKWTRPSRSPANLQVGLETLSTTPKTLEDPGRP
jgi:hypothetical protein